jgi:predicted MFS family arabinose efflux permease
MTRYDPVMALQRYRGIIANPAALPLFAAVAVEGGLVFGTFPFIAPLMIERGIGSTMEAGFAIGAFGLGGLVFAALVAPLLARFGQAGVIRIGGATAALALIGFALAPSLVIAALSGLGLGLGFYMIHNAIQTRATELAPQARASAMSLHAFAFFGGQSLGPIFYGLGDMIIGLPATLGLAAGGIMVLALLLARR